MKPLGIYIHIPFCKRKCYYCDFLSFSQKEEFVQEYIEVLKKEIILKKQKAEDRKIDTIYIGGGTPSFIKGEFILEIMEVIRKNYAIVKNPEITIEINPGTITKQKLQQYKKASINRISMGLQSICNERLKQLGRIHTKEEFEQNYNLTREVGFNNINIDFMLGIPNQSLEEIKTTLQYIAKWNPEHVSTYSLIVEENTVMQKQIQTGKTILPEEDLERKMYWKIKEGLEELGYQHYEISNFAKPNKQCKHNLHCWNQEEYLGFGLAAHSYQEDVRYCNTEDLNFYMQNIKSGKMEQNKIIQEVQNKEEKRKEYMLLGLRKLQGVNGNYFYCKFGDNLQEIFEKEIKKLEKLGLLNKIATKKVFYYDKSKNNSTIKQTFPLLKTKREKFLKEQENLHGKDLRKINLSISSEKRRIAKLKTYYPTIFLTNKGLDFANAVWKEFI